jgi:DNA-binding response OmpR family regulator
VDGASPLASNLFTSFSAFCYQFLDKSDLFTRLYTGSARGAVREVTERVRIGTQLLGQADDQPVTPVPQQGADGMLLAVVPIPGTGTSLAIVGYPVAGPGAAPDEAAAAEAEGVRTGLLLDHEQRRVWADGREIVLTFQEFELLAFLSAHPATVFSRADLVERVWQRRFAADSRTVDVHVSRLRHKLGPAYGRCLVTEYRVGYMFRPPAG